MKITKPILMLILLLLPAALDAKTNLEVESFIPENQPLLSPANPALTGINQLQVNINIHASGAENALLDSNELEFKAVKKLIQAGFGIFAAGEKQSTAALPDIPLLRVDINLLKIADSQNYAFIVETALAKEVYLNHNSPFTVKADLWKNGPKLAVCPSTDLKQDIITLIDMQLDAFIVSHRASNLKDNTQTRIAPQPLTTQKPPALKPQPFAEQYAASKNSKIFHKSSCSSALSINPDNMITYKTRDEAIQAGKRPCKRCAP